MKKKLVSGLFALALLVATGYGVQNSMRSDAGLSDLALVNVEALARWENDPLPECLKPYDVVCKNHRDPERDRFFCRA